MASNNISYKTSADTITLFNNLQEDELKTLIEHGPDFHVSSLTYKLFDCIVNICEKHVPELCSQKISLFIESLVNVKVEAKRVNNLIKSLTRRKANLKKSMDDILYEFSEKNTLSFARIDFDDNTEVRVELLDPDYTISVGDFHKLCKQKRLHWNPLVTFFTSYFKFPVSYSQIRWKYDIVSSEIKKLRSKTAREMQGYLCECLVFKDNFHPVDCYL